MPVHYQINRKTLARPLSEHIAHFNQSVFRSKRRGLVIEILPAVNACNLPVLGDNIV